ncbi:MAG: hypothetical protein RG741_00430 [Bacteroidales bacterium]|nr:hypothetical protein [Bacteroidales bacterium]
MRHLLTSLSVIITGLISFNTITAQENPGKSSHPQFNEFADETNFGAPSRTSATRIPFQGRLFEDGEPVNGVLSMTFSIQDIGWNETHDNVMVTNGLYSVDLGDVNPLPQSLFYGVQSHSLTINIGETELSPISIYPPYVNNTFNVTSPASWTDWNIALRGYSDGEGTGPHFGLHAVASGTHDNFGALTAANGNGMFNIGIRGLSIGQGDGSEGSWNTGVQGFARSNSWGNTGVYGWVYNDPFQGGIGTINTGVAGLSEVNDGSATIVNVGVNGDAKGSGINIGIQGQASGGAENWAGWFNGDVKITGNLIVDGDGGGNGSGFQLPDNVYIGNEEGADDKFAGQMRLSGHESINIDMGGHWHDKDLAMIYLHGNQPSEGWYYPHVKLEVEKDGENQWGSMRLYGSNGNENMHFGTYHWEPDGANRPYISMSGNSGEMIELAVRQNYDIGEEFGDLNLKSTNGAFTYLGATNLFIQGSQAPNLSLASYSNSNLPILDLYGNQPTNDGWFYNHIQLSVGEDGDQQWGAFKLWGNNGNENVLINAHHWESNDGANRPYMSMIGNEYEHARIGVGYDGNHEEQFGYLSLQGNNGHDNFVFGALHWEGTGGANRPFMQMTGNNHGQPLMWMSVNQDGQGGEHGFLSIDNSDGSSAQFRSNHISLNSNTGTNVSFGPKAEGYNDLPYLFLFGQDG